MINCSFYDWYIQDNIIDIKIEYGSADIKKNAIGQWHFSEWKKT